MRRQIRLEHVISFADAIFAFSITFMAISIQIPNLAQNLTQTQVINRLVELVPEFEIYVISFFVIGIYWIAYHLICTPYQLGSFKPVLRYTLEGTEYAR
jgi:uncharacterized membrane protein